MALTTLNRVEVYGFQEDERPRSAPPTHLDFRTREVRAPQRGSTYTAVNRGEC